jgi:hypothetical protein
MKISVNQVDPFFSTQPPKHIETRASSPSCPSEGAGSVAEALGFAFRLVEFLASYGLSELMCWESLMPGED